MSQAGNPVWNLHIAFAHIPHNMSWQRLSLPKDAAYSITACADQAWGALSIQKCPRRKKAEESQWFNTADIFFSFLCSPHVFKKCWILRQVHICYFTTGGEKLILGRSRNIKKKKSHRKRAVLPPRPAKGSSPGNTKAFLEWARLPRTHINTHSHAHQEKTSLRCPFPPEIKTLNLNADSWWL